MSATTTKEPTPNFIDILKSGGGEKQYYIVKTNIRNSNKFRYMPASEKYQSVDGMSFDEFRRLYPNAVNKSAVHGLLDDEETYEQAVIGIADSEGFVMTRNREHAKLIFKEARSLDPRVENIKDGKVTVVRSGAFIHSESIPFDPDEEIDLRAASWPACAADKNAGKDNKIKK